MERKRTYGVWAVRSSTSIFGPAQSWCKENGKPLEFDSKADAENYAKEANEHTTANVRYYVQRQRGASSPSRQSNSRASLGAPIAPLPRNRLAFSYWWTRVPVLPEMPSAAFSSRVMRATRPGLDSAKDRAACTLGSMEPGAKWPRSM